LLCGIVEVQLTTSIEIVDFSPRTLLGLVQSDDGNWAGIDGGAAATPGVANPLDHGSIGIASGDGRFGAMGHALRRFPLSTPRKK
jgi:hypothetical protein